MKDVYWNLAHYPRLEGSGAPALALRSSWRHPRPSPELKPWVEFRAPKAAPVVKAGALLPGAPGARPAPGLASPDGAGKPWSAAAPWSSPAKVRSA